MNGTENQNKGKRGTDVQARSRKDKENETLIDEKETPEKVSSRSPFKDTPRDKEISLLKVDAKTIEGVKNMKINQSPQKETCANANGSLSSSKDVAPGNKDPSIINKSKSMKAVSNSTDPIKKKKKAVPSKKKARGVQDQEVPDKKQTTLTDHFQVRRSERKLKALAEDSAKLVLQKKILSGSELGLEIKVLEEKGRGIFASTRFPKGSFVCEYAGELVEFNEAKDREVEYEKTPEVGSYMYFFQYKDNKYCVDATQESDRLGRLLNHSKTTSNVLTKVFPINDVPHLILLASRDVEKGEELLYDYGDRSKNSLESHPWLKN